jgi:nucleoside-diphosphate-sugar epimerase
MKFTVLGASGFLGSHIVNYLQKNNFNYDAPDIRKENITSTSLGHVIYSIGTVDFSDPSKNVETHTCILNDILQNNNFDSLLYISTGRIYYNSKSTTEESDILVSSTDKNRIYNLSKLTGESLCLSSENKNIKIIRPSNITGIKTPTSLFIPSIINDAIKKHRISLQSSLDTQRDYLAVNDFVKILPEIILNGKHRIYNVAHGTNTKTKEIVDEITKNIDCEVHVALNAPDHSFPSIDISRIQNEFNFKSQSIINELKTIIEYYKN